MVSDGEKINFSDISDSVFPEHTIKELLDQVLKLPPNIEKYLSECSRKHYKHWKSPGPIDYKYEISSESRFLVISVSFSS